MQDYAGDIRAVAGSFGPILRRYAFGVDDRPLDFSSEAKSISSENTFLKDTADRRVLRSTLREQSAEIAAELQEKRLAAKTIQVTVRYGDFTKRTRQITIEDRDSRGGRDLPFWLSSAGPA